MRCRRVPPPLRTARSREGRRVPGVNRAAGTETLSKADEHTVAWGRGTGGRGRGLRARADGVPRRRPHPLNDAGLGLVNSQTAKVTAGGDGRGTFRVQDGRALDMTAGDPQRRDIYRGWALTVHAFQGRTIDKVIAAIEANLTDQEMLYVRIRHARDRAKLVTDDKAWRKVPLAALSGERIAALEALGEEKARASETGAGRELGVVRDGSQPGTGAREDARAEDRGSGFRAVRRMRRAVRITISV